MASNFASRIKNHRVLLMLVVVVAVLGTAPLFSSACSTTTSVVITNNSTALEFRHLYLSSDANNWGPDQLNGSVISAGSTYTLNNMSCSGNSTRVIVEDQNGCFLYQTVGCDGDATWTISSSTPRDCGR